MWSPDGPPSKRPPVTTLFSFHAQGPPGCCGARGHRGRPQQGSPRLNQWHRWAGNGRPESQWVVEIWGDKWGKMGGTGKPKACRQWCPLAATYSSLHQALPCLASRLNHLLSAIKPEATVQIPRGWSRLAAGVQTSRKRESESQGVVGKQGNNQEKAGGSRMPKTSRHQDSQVTPDSSPHQTCPCSDSGLRCLQVGMAPGSGRRERGSQGIGWLLESRVTIGSMQ